MSKKIIFLGAAVFGGLIVIGSLSLYFSPSDPSDVKILDSKVHSITKAYEGDGKTSFYIDFQGDNDIDRVTLSRDAVSLGQIAQVTNVRTQERTELVVNEFNEVSSGRLHVEHGDRLYVEIINTNAPDRQEIKPDIAARRDEAPQKSDNEK